ncbi:MAG TPA: anti-sigma factor [Nitrososphaeraceae archaeon]|nr:anti-sigma factor [Nitrososphaeraceae archaeon]
MSAQQTLDLKTPGGNEAFGGDSKGTVSLVPKEHTVYIVANMSTPPKEGKVFEGWLVDVGGSDYKLSVGEFSKDGALQFTETMVNPYTYTQFLVTEEPFEDPDPNAASVIAGAELVGPFGQ